MQDYNVLLKEIISLIDEIIREEDFPAYTHIKLNCEIALKDLQQNQIDKSLENIDSSIHLLLEAPPRNSILGDSLINKLDSLYRWYLI